MLSVPAIYEDGKITLLEQIPHLHRARVIVTVLEELPFGDQEASTEKLPVNSWLGSMRHTAQIVGDIVGSLEETCVSKPHARNLVEFSFAESIDIRSATDLRRCAALSPASTAAARPRRPFYCGHRHRIQSNPAHRRQASAPICRTDHLVSPIKTLSRQEIIVKLYLIRHGQSFVNLEDWDWESDTMDQPLTELGQRQAMALAAWLPQHLAQIDALYCSTMQRARQTAAPLAEVYQRTIQFDDRVREIGNNQINHVAWPDEQLPRKYATGWPTARPFSPTMSDAESSESFMHTRVRVGLFLEQIVERHRDEVVMVVCHGGVFDCVFDHVFNVGPWRRTEIWTHNTGVSHFEYVALPNREVWRLQYHNRTEHLYNLENA